MKKIMGHLTGKLSLSILSVIVLLVGVLAGLNRITSVKAGGKRMAAASRSSQNGLVSAAQVTDRQPAAPLRAAAAPAAKPPVSAGKAPEPITKQAARTMLAKMPLVFEPNRGQTDSRAKFIARSMGYQVFMTGPDSARLKFRASETDLKTTDFITMKLDGANTAAVAQPQDPTGGVSNYWLGSDPSKWLSGVPNYARLRYDNIYPGIDVVYQGDRARFRYDFNVNPGADPKAIRISYEGGKKLSLDKDGNAMVDLGYGQMVASKPTIYQEYGGQQHMVDGRYVITASNTLGFEIGAYDKSQTLVIDPADTYAAFIGQGSKIYNTVVTAVAMDSSGPYMAGWTADLTFASANPVKGTNGTTGNNGTLGFYAKGTLLQPAVSTTTTYFGSITPTGASYTAAYGIATSTANAGVPYIVGVTNAASQWPSVGPLETAPVNLINPHAFILVGGSTSPTFSSLLYGSGLDIATAVAVDVKGNIHVTGGTTSGATSPAGTSSLIANLNPSGGSLPYQAAQASDSGQYNAFYIDIAANFKSVVYATLFGGWNNDIGNGIATDTACASPSTAACNAYIVGTSNSFGGGTIVGILQGGSTTTEVSGGGGVSQFALIAPTGSGCPANPLVLVDPPIPSSTFVGVPMPAQATAIVNDTALAPLSNEQVVGITITNPGAGYNPLTQPTVGVHVLGCSTPATGLRAQVFGGAGTLFAPSGNNIPIPQDVLNVTTAGTGYSALNPPVVTITGGSCVVEPTATALVSLTSPFGIAGMVLDTPGTGCTSPPTVTIAPPATVGGITGITATATYTMGTVSIPVNPTGLQPSNSHAFVAKFNPTMANPAGATTINPASLSYAVAIGGAVDLIPGFTPGTCVIAGNPANPGNLPPSETNQIIPGGEATIGGLDLAGSNGNVPTRPSSGEIGECEAGTAIAVDQYGNAYVGGNALIPFNEDTEVGLFNGGGPTATSLFTSPGTAGGEIAALILTSGGLGYPANTNIGIFFDWTHDINGGCLIYPSANADTDAAGSIITEPSGVLGLHLESRGFGCTSVPGVGFDGQSGSTIVATAMATLATPIAGVATNGGDDSGNPVSSAGFVLEIVSNQVLSGGLTTTNSQDGIPLGPHAPSSVAGWPAMVYATFLGGDEDCTVCINGTTIVPGAMTGGFGNGTALTTEMGATESGVEGVAVDGLGQAYISGFITNAAIPAGDIPSGDTSTGDQYLLVHRRITSKGFPDIPFCSPNVFPCSSGSYSATTISDANSQYLSDFPVIPNAAMYTSAPAPVFPNAGITPFGDVIIGPGATTTPPSGTGTPAPNPYVGAFLGAGFDPVTLTFCSAGYVDDFLPAKTTTVTGGPSPITSITAVGGDQTPTGIFSTGGAEIQTAITVGKPPSAALPSFPAEGIAACTPFTNDIVVGVQTGNPANPVITSFTFNMEAGVTNTTPGGAFNSNIGGGPTQMPPDQNLTITLDGANTNGGVPTITLGPITKTYYEGKSSNGPPSAGNPLFSSYDWLIVSTAGSTVTFGLDPTVSGITPPASFLDPGTYYCVVTITPTAPGADNSGIPQSFIVTLNVTGLIEINTALNGGAPAPGSNTAGTVISASLSQGTLNTAAWQSMGTGAPNLDPAGNLVINVPITVPPSLPSFSHEIFLLNQGGVGPVALTNVPLPNGGANYPGPQPLTLEPDGKTVSPWPILNTGLNTGAPVLLGSTAGSVYLTPAAGLIEMPDGSFNNDVNDGALPLGYVDCSQLFVNPPDTNDATAKAGVDKTPSNSACYIQIVIPPTILQGAPLGTYTTTLVFQSVPNLTDPETPVRNDESHPYIDAVPWTAPNLVSTANPFDEFICVGSGCPVTYAPPPPTSSATPSVTGYPSGGTSFGALTLAITVQPGPLLTNSPWQTNSITSCLSAVGSPAGFGFANYNCNTNGPVIQIAPFEIPSGYQGTVTSAINGFPGGNNPNNTFNDFVLDSRNLGWATQGGYEVTSAPGLGSVNLGTVVSPLQVANDLYVYQLFPVPSFYPSWYLPTCTLNMTNQNAPGYTQPIPAGVLTVNSTATSATPVVFSGVLPASNASQTTTAMNIGITNAAGLANGFYASTLTVTPIPSGGVPSAAQATQVPVCLEVGNNVIAEFETIFPPITVPPLFDPTGNIVPPDGLVMEVGSSQYLQIFASTLGPNQIAPLNGTATFGPPSFVAVPLSIAPPSPLPTGVVIPLTSLPNIGNEFSIVPIGSITEGSQTANNCPFATGAATGPCLTDAYMDFLIGPTFAGGPITFTLTPTGSGLLSASVMNAIDPPSGTPVTLPVVSLGGPELVYCSTASSSSQQSGQPGTCVPPSTTAANSGGTVAYISLVSCSGNGVGCIGDLFFGGAGYTAVPNITITGGGCTTEPVAIASISQPGSAGYISQIYMTNPGAGCTSTPTVTIDAPQTGGGVPAAILVVMSNADYSFTFNEPANQTPAVATSCLTGSNPCSGPSYQTITVQTNTPGISIATPTSLFVPPILAPTIYYNPPVLAPTGWLNVATVNCQPLLVNPTPLLECQFTLSLQNTTELNTGTYQAYVDFVATGFPQGTEPAVVEAIVTLNVTNLSTVTTTLPVAGATFSYIIGAATTTPASPLPGIGGNLSVTFLPSGVSSIPATVTPTVNNGPAGWLQVSLGGGTPSNGPQNINLTTSPISIVISVGNLSGFTAPGPYTGVVTITTSSSLTSNSTISIPVTVNVTSVPSVQFSDTTPADAPTVTCSVAGGNESCTATAAFTIGQTASQPTGYTPIVTLLNGGGDTLTITSNASWLMVTPNASATASTPLTVTIIPANFPTPVTAGPLVGVITAKGVNGPESATFTVNLTIANPPTINMTAITPQPLTAVNGAAPFQITTNVSLSSAPANPSVLPVSCTVTGGGAWLSVTPGNPTTISTTPAAFNFTVTPANEPPGNFNAGQITCTTTGGITPALTNSISVHLSVNGILNDTTPSGTNFSNATGIYTIGTPAPTLPLGIWTNPSAGIVSIASSATWLSVSTTPVTAGPQATPTMVTVSVVTSDPAVLGATNGQVLTANLTLSTPESVADGANAPNGLNCAATGGPDTVVGSGPTATCTITIPFTVTIFTTPTITTSPVSGSTITYNLPTLAGAPGSDSNANMSVAVSITSGTPPVRQAVAFTATPTVVTPAGGTWLGATGGTTTTTGPAATSTVSVTVGSLPQGVYSGAVAFAGTGSQGQSNVGVLLNVGTLAVSGGPVNFAHQFGVTVPATSTLNVTAGPASINWVASATPNSGTANCNWLIPGPASGTTVGGGNDNVSVSYNPAVLPDANASYSCNINYSPAPSYGASAADTVSVTVNLVTSINPVWVVTPNTAQTEYVLVGATTAPPTTFQVAASSILAPATTITATITPFPNNPLATGTPNPIFTAPGTLTVPASPNSVALVITANPSGLPVGTYQGSFTITSPSITNPAVVTVNLVVQPLGCNFVVSPSTPVALTNVVPANGSTPVSVPGAFSVTPGNTAPACTSAVIWSAASNASWLIITSGGNGNGGTVGSGTYLALSNSTPFARTATITFTPSVGPLEVIQVTQPASTAAIQLLEVTALYQQILGRDPDSGGYTFWTGQGSAGLGLMADAFFTSPESYNTNFAVIAAYQAATNAPPTFAAFTSSVLSVRYGGLTVGNVFSSLIAGNTLYSTTNLYQNLLGRAPGSGDAACVASGAVACFQTIIGLGTSANPVGPGTNSEFWSTGTFANHTGACTTGICTVSGDHTNLLYMYMLYFTTLNRDPDAGGLQFWFGIANGGGAGVLFQGGLEQPVRIQVEGTGTPGQGFIGSSEFQSKF
jgi:Domain of unknown function (DUF4214)